MPDIVSTDWPIERLRRHPVSKGLRKIGWWWHSKVLCSPRLTARTLPLGLKVTGSPPDWVLKHLYCRGTFDPYVTQFVLSRVRLGPSDVALDVGANLGWVALNLARMGSPDATIVAMEPDPENFALLQHNVAANGHDNIIAMHTAAGEKAGELALYQHSGSNRGRHSLLPLSGNGSAVRVPVTSLEDAWRTHNLGDRPLKFLKIDVEGYEAFVLRGAGELLSRCELALIEYSPSFMREAGLDPVEVIDRLEEAGLDPYVWRDGRLHAIDRDALLAVPRQMDLVWKAATV